MKDASKQIILTTFDKVWKEHLHNFDYLRQGIYPGELILWSKDPLNEYEREAFILFEQMLDRLRELDVQRLCYLHIDMEHVNRQSVMIANKELHARNAC